MPNLEAISSSERKLDCVLERITARFASTDYPYRENRGKHSALPDGNQSPNRSHANYLTASQKDRKHFESKLTDVHHSSGIHEKELEDVIVGLQSRITRMSSKKQAAHKNFQDNIDDHGSESVTGQNSAISESITPSTVIISGETSGTEKQTENKQATDEAHETASESFDLSSTISSDRASSPDNVGTTSMAAAPLGLNVIHTPGIREEEQEDVIV